MCGIVGYKGNNNCIKILIEGLKKLEYRGYDSAGIALFDDQKIEIIKSIGKIINLENKMDFNKNNKYVGGIAHTRWATHGSVDLTNTHPHQVGKITIVHNGIIENADYIRSSLELKGYKFQSKTDTEVIAALLDYNLEKDFLKTINKTMNLLKGSYALGIINENELDRIYAVKKDSPLVIGIGKNENFFASDISAINNYTNQFMLLKEKEVAVIKADNVEIYKDLVKQKNRIDTIDIKTEDNNKNGYRHYMLKEIKEEPIVLEKLLKKYLDNFDLIPDISDYNQIHIVACGSAMYAGIIAKYLFEEKLAKHVIAEVASEYRYMNVNYDMKTLVILISQSGETADTIAAMRYAKENKIDTLAIVNNETSTIAREADKVLFIEAGEEVAVATTKAYLLQIAMLSLLALRVAKNEVDIKDYFDEFKLIPKLIQDIINKEKDYIAIANQIYKNDNAFFVGRKIDYAYCLEGSLKLKEVSYIHSQAYQAGELKHGTISLIDKDMPVIGILTDEDIYEKTLSNIIEVDSRGAKTIIITTNKLNVDSKLKIVVPQTSIFTQGLLIAPVLQLLAYHTALLRNCDIDKPKNLAKSVTVE